MTRKMLFGLMAAGAVAAAGTASLAQPPEGGLSSRRGPPPGAEGRGPVGPEQRATQLRTQLSITPAQENAFQAYLAATAPPQRGGMRQQRQQMQGMTTPQRLDAQLAEAAQRQTDLKARVDATKRFYNALSATQRTAFDALPPNAVLGMAPGGRAGGGRMAGGPRGGRQGRGFGADAPGGYDPQ